MKNLIVVRVHEGELKQVFSNLEAHVILVHSNAPEGQPNFAETDAAAFAQMPTLVTSHLIDYLNSSDQSEVKELVELVAAKVA